MPDTITTPEGVAFRPNLLATTSGRAVSRAKPVSDRVVAPVAP